MKRRQLLISTRELNLDLLKQPSQLFIDMLKSKYLQEQEKQMSLLISIFYIKLERNDLVNGESKLMTLLEGINLVLNTQYSQLGNTMQNKTL